MLEQQANHGRRPRRNLSDTRHSRRLLVQRLREIDRLTVRELATMRADIRQLKNRRNH